jgi:hypothetical protein
VNWASEGTEGLVETSDQTCQRLKVIYEALTYHALQAMCITSLKPRDLSNTNFKCGFTQPSIFPRGVQLPCAGCAGSQSERLLSQPIFCSVSWTSSQSQTLRIPSASPTYHLSYRIFGMTPAKNFPTFSIPSYR